MYLSSKARSGIGKVAKLWSVAAIISAAVVSLSSESSEQVGNALDKSEISNSGPDQKKLFALWECTRNKWRFLVDGLHEDKTKTIHGSNWSKAKVNPRNNNLYVHIGGANKPYHIRLDQENKVWTLNWELEGNEIVALNKSLHILLSECEKKTREKNLSKTFNWREYSNERTFKDFNGLNEFCYHVRGRELTSPSQAKTAQKYDAFIKLGDVTIDFNWVDILEKDSCGLEWVSISFNNFYWEKIEYQLSKNGSFQLFFKGNWVSDDTKDIPDLDQERRIPNLDDFIEFIIDHVKKTHGDFSIQAHPQEEVPDGSIIDPDSGILIPKDLKKWTPQALWALRYCTRNRWRFWYVNVGSRIRSLEDNWAGQTYGGSKSNLHMRKWDFNISYKWFGKSQTQDIGFPSDADMMKEHWGEYITAITGDEAGKFVDPPTGRELSYVKSIVARLLASCMKKEIQPERLSAHFMDNPDKIYLTEWNNYIEEITQDEKGKLLESLNQIHGALESRWLLQPWVRGKIFSADIDNVWVTFDFTHITSDSDGAKKIEMKWSQVTFSYPNYYNEPIRHTVKIEENKIHVNTTTASRDPSLDYKHGTKIPHISHVIEKVLSHLSPKG